MNDSAFGLTAAIWTADVDAAERDRRPRRDRHRVHEPLRLSRSRARLDRRQGFRPRRTLSRSASRSHPPEILSPATSASDDRS